MEERFLDDISYNFLIGADGRVYEGRGWAKVPGHARGRGRGTLAFAIIGSFVNELPPAVQLDTLFRWGEVHRVQRFGLSVVVGEHKSCKTIRKYSPLKNL